MRKRATKVIHYSENKAVLEPNPNTYRPHKNSEFISMKELVGEK